MSSAVSRTRAFGASFAQMRGLERERDELTAAEAERSQRADFLKFQIDELQSAELQPGEDEKLQQEKQLLQSSETRVQAAHQVVSLLESDEDGVLDRL